MEPQNWENKGTSLQLRTRSSLRMKQWSVKDEIKRFKGRARGSDASLILVNLIRGSRACAFHLHRALPGDDVEIFQVNFYLYEPVLV